MDASAAGASGRLVGLRPMLVGLVLVTGVVYANSLGGPFLFDDLGIERAVTFRSRPVVRLSFELNRWIGGNDPWGYHLFNVLVHAAAGLLFFGVVRRTLDLGGDAGRRRRNAGLAGACALLWLVHPLQTESVAYVSQRAEALAGLFVLGLFYGFVRWVGAPGNVRWALVGLASFALGMATKEIVACAPVLLWLHDRTFVAGGFRAALRARPRFYAALAGTWGVLFALLIARLVAEAYSSPEESTIGGYAVAAFTPLEYARTQPGVILHYLGLAFWPHPLCLDYAWPAARRLGEFLPQTLALAALVGATLFAVARRHALGFLGAWFFVILAPTSSIVPIQDAAFEHRMYLPLAALVVLTVVALDRLCARLAPRLAPVLLALAATALAATTVRRNQDYRSALGMWDAVVAVAPHNPRAQRSRGVYLLEAGRAEEAARAYERAIELGPRPGDFVQLGHAYFALGQHAQAAAAFETALASPQADHARHGDTYLPVATAELGLGRAYQELGDLPRARRAFERALLLEPSALAHCNLANALVLAGDVAAAEEHYRAALRLGLDEASVHYSLASVLRVQGAIEEALREYDATLRLDPEHPKAHTDLALCLSSLGRRGEALEHYRTAARRTPGGAEERFNLGRALLASGAHEAAADELREACRLDPELPRALDLLARALLTKAQGSALELQEAIRAAERAVALTSSSSPELLETLGDAHAASGDFARARETLERALALVPPDRTAFRERLRASLERARAGAASGG